MKTIPLSTQERRDFEKRWNESEAMQHLGARIELGEDDIIRATIEPLVKHHRGGLGTDAVNGVIMSGLFDLVIGVVGVFNASGKRAGTAQLSMSFIKPVLGNKVTAESWLVKGGGNVIFASGHIKDENGKICARCDGLIGVSSKSN